MDEKIKLEEELDFLKESFEAGVITKEEYENTKARIENQLKEMDVKKPTEAKEEATGVKKEEPKTTGEAEDSKTEKEETEETAKEQVEEEAQGKEKVGEEPKKEDEIEIKEIRAPSKIKEIKEDGMKMEDKEKAEKKEGQSKGAEGVDEKEKDTNDILNSTKIIDKPQSRTKISSWAPIAALVFLMVIGYFSFLFFTTEKPQEVLPICSSDADCTEEGMIGFCVNPNSEYADCEFREAESIGLTILNTKDCFNCDTARVEKIIKGWFPGIVKSEVDFNSEDGKALAKKLNIGMLPAFIFNSSLESAFKYAELKSIFSKVNDTYVLSPAASGSTFYLKREEAPKRLDVFLMEGDPSTKRAEENIEEFLDVFEGKINYTRHFVGKQDELAKALGINTFPTFIINNKIRFTGVQPAETIKENFCKMNELEECNENLTKGLV
jgi:hypothetical protein